MIMKIIDIKNIAVIGAGNMGHQISTLCALYGYKTTCTDVSQEILKKADAFVDTYLKGRVQKGKLDEEQAKKARANITFTPKLEDAVKDADYVIEAAIEVLDIKRKLFADIDRLAPSHAILATNSSRIVSSRIADATKRPSKVCNLHFFNPALVMKLVEVVSGPHCAEDTVEVSVQLCNRLEKVPIVLKKEVDGFVLNRLLGALMKEALWLNDMGIASFEDVDKACVYGAGYPMGPFRLMDLTGIDLEYTMRMEAFRRTGDRAELPSPAVVERYMRGDYGEKSGKGWYDHKSEKKK
jgi:3-hydroxybutyryl-CoA dehydrogenase